MSEKKISKSKMARIILRSTPGVVADNIFELHGIRHESVKNCGIARRAGGFGWTVK